LTLWRTGSFALALWLFCFSNFNLRSIPLQPVNLPFPSCLFTTDTLYTDIANCNGQASMCIPFSFDYFDNYSISDNGVPLTGFIEGCNQQQVLAYSFVQFAQVDFILQNWQVGATAHSGEFTNVVALADSMNVWDANGGWQVNLSHNIIYNENISANNSNLEIIVGNSSAFAVESFESEFTLGTNVYLVTGLHELVFAANNGSCSDTLYVKVTCTDITTQIHNVALGMIDTICLEFPNLISQPASVQNTCPSSGGINASYEIQVGATCVIVSGLQIGTDTLCIEACDSFGICGLTYVVVNVPDPAVGQQRIAFESSTNTQGEICLDTTHLNGTILTVQNICATSGIQTTFTLDTTNYCVVYQTSNSPSLDSACFVICDAFNVCDTTMIVIQTTADLNAFTHRDTLMTDAPNFYCIDPNIVGGNITSIVSGCSPQSINFNINPVSNCINYTIENAVTDTACFYITGNTGDVDTLYLIVQGIAPNSSIAFDSVRVGETITFCTDNSEIYGFNLSISNFCEGFGGENAAFELSNDTTCVVITGIAIGLDTACLVVCNGLNTCDTTYLVMQINYTPEQVQFAFPDSFSVMQNDFLQMNVLANDAILLGDSLLSIRILRANEGGVNQQYGNAVIGDNSIIEYIPNLNVCDQTDMIIYEACTEDLGCDTATVLVTILCQDSTIIDPTAPIIVFNGFSPNGDNINDIFHIENVENHPINTLQVYNRWGNLVYEATNYNNDWNGKWDGKDLPDGTYFYYFKYDDTRFKSGYVYIQR
ncbi:MAG: gliding motility-associated C-terminal domain-containing protein, partial [Saprospiraceae bacterium]